MKTMTTFKVFIQISLKVMSVEVIKTFEDSVELIDVKKCYPTYYCIILARYVKTQLTEKRIFSYVNLRNLITSQTFESLTEDFRVEMICVRFLRHKSKTWPQGECKANPDTSYHHRLMVVRTGGAQVAPHTGRPSPAHDRYADRTGLSPQRKSKYPKENIVREGEKWAGADSPPVLGAAGGQEPTLLLCWVLQVGRSRLSSCAGCCRWAGADSPPVLGAAGGQELDSTLWVLQVGRSRLSSCAGCCRWAGADSPPVLGAAGGQEPTLLLCWVLQPLPLAVLLLTTSRLHIML
ncbi:unnamed protein product [Ranitomeya imitator]|uniref:Uncharacterized protein n=1 Tax=Ranitomeya imitator TaxID=111125 RepID=A0ABN9L2L4_9NEOB|nr:unnamed protein product [Ranitomeya imitator]